MNDPGLNQNRIVFQRVVPEIDCGLFPVKRIIGDEITVEADIFADGHDAISAVLLFRYEGEERFEESPMEFLVNDHWAGSFHVKRMGLYRYTIAAWIDRFATWQQDLKKNLDANQDTDVDFLEGSLLINEVISRANSKDAEELRKITHAFTAANKKRSSKVRLALSSKASSLMNKYPEKKSISFYQNELSVVVEPERVRYSTWYEMFPRSASLVPGKHGTFKDCKNRLPYIAEMGFDVLYFPPIHPVGKTNRKGRNNRTVAATDEPGTPWAIGSEQGGHKTIHPALGTLEDFHELIQAAETYNIAIALDIAFQCSPDHPYVIEHPEWFRWRPDGTIQYAKNPPKKYQDIYPINFDTPHHEALWKELKSIIDFWIEQGVRIFRVDNPHTKPFDFWEWLITGIKKEHPEIIFLSEAFTRPKIMYRLAKLGFNQSYTYFTWRTSKWEFTEYLTELTQTEVSEYFQPNFWPNTPDILSDYLRDGGRPAFMTRLVLAATLSSSYGIYGPAFELCKNERKDKQSEEYLNSEKYELKRWDIENPDSLKDFIATVNCIRKENPALHYTLNLHFHRIDNDKLICYSKTDPAGTNTLLVVVNIDYDFVQSGWTDLDLTVLGLIPGEQFEIHDLLADTAYSWWGSRNYVELDPHRIPAHIFRIKRERTIPVKK